MALYSLIDVTGPSVLQEGKSIEGTPADFTGHPTKGDWKWVPFTFNSVTIDSETEIAEPDLVVLTTDEHTITQQKRLLTQQELDQRDSDLKDAEIQSIETPKFRAMFEAIFDQENRLRALEGNGSITRAQLLNAMRTALDNIP